MAEIFRDSGYATLALGKWHLTKDADMSDAGPKKSWPLQRGFDRYYGFLDAFTNLHQPHRLVEDNHTLVVDEYPDDYYLTDDLTDRALDMIAQVKASNPSTPFLCYLAEGAVHAPLHCKSEDLERRRGRYDIGWDAIRAARHERQLAMGVIPPGTELPPRNAEAGDEVPAWDDLSVDDQRLYARYMEVFAAMVDNVDQNVGRLRAGLDELGVLDNTIFVFLSDNGASREGESAGTSAYFRTLVSKNVKDIEDLDADLARIDLLGGPQTMVHYPRGWAMASNTPWRLYKINTHAGGHSVPFLVSWPDGGDAVPVGERRNQWAFVTDVLPTLLELTGVERRSTRGDVALQPLTGATLVPSLRDENAAARPHRAVLRDGGSSRLLPRRLGDRHPTPGAHRVRRPRVGAVRPRYRSDGAAEPRDRASGARGGDVGALGGDGARQPGVPPRRGLTDPLRDPPAVRGTVHARRSGCGAASTRSSASGRSS